MRTEADTRGHASQAAPLGRMTSKSRSSYSADYTYGPSSMLWGVESDFPGEGDATYDYGLLEQAEAKDIRSSRINPKTGSSGSPRHGALAAFEGGKGNSKQISGLHIRSSGSPFEGGLGGCSSYGGDGKRGNRVTATDETWYNWAGWSVLMAAGSSEDGTYLTAGMFAGQAVPLEEDDADGTGNFTRWERLRGKPSLNMGRNGAHADGSNPSTGTWRYYTHDHLSSTRNVYDSSKNRLASYDYTPYGEVYASASFPTANHTFTGHAWDSASGMYFAPFRHYVPGLGRWITPDPLGMVEGTNVYAYTSGNPVVLIDLLGLADKFTLWGACMDGDDISGYYGYGGLQRGGLALGAGSTRGNWPIHKATEKAVGTALGTAGKDIKTVQSVNPLEGRSWSVLRNLKRLKDPVSAGARVTSTAKAVVGKLFAFATIAQGAYDSFRMGNCLGKANDWW